MKIKQSVINTFNRQQIPYEELLQQTGSRIVENWISGETVETTPLIAYLIRWVYTKQLAFERGKNYVLMILIG